MARQEEVQDERWFHHYLLGKIAEKKEEHIMVVLNHYIEVMELNSSSLMKIEASSIVWSYISSFLVEISLLEEANLHIDEPDASP